MKTIVELETNESKYLENDDTVINVFEDRIEVGDPLIYVIGDLNSENSEVIENVTAPNEWIGCKYLYVDGAFEINSSWEDLES